jgi:hypothetical protein
VTTTSSPQKTDPAGSVDPGGGGAEKLVSTRGPDPVGARAGADGQVSSAGWTSSNAPDSSGELARRRVPNATNSSQRNGARTTPGRCDVDAHEGRRAAGLPAAGSAFRTGVTCAPKGEYRRSNASVTPTLGIFVRFPMKATAGTLAWTLVLSLIVWTTFFAMTPEAPLTQGETGVVVGATGGAVLLVRWILTRCRGKRRRDAAQP